MADFIDDSGLAPPPPTAPTAVTSNDVEAEGLGTTTTDGVVVDDDVANTAAVAGGEHGAAGDIDGDASLPDSVGEFGVERTKSNGVADGEGPDGGGGGSTTVTGEHGGADGGCGSGPGSSNEMWMTQEDEESDVKEPQVEPSA